MHNKYATYVLPVLAGLAIVGAGFSTWVFNGDGSTDSETLNGTITVAPADDTFNAAIELGTIDQASFTKDESLAFTLLLDQGGVSEASNKNVGISVTSGLESYDIKWTANKENLGTSYNGYNLTLTYDVAVSYGDAAGKYIVWAGTATGSTTIGLDALTTTDNQTYTYLWETNIGNTWNYESKPADFGEYSTMVSELEGNSSISLTVTVTAELTK